MVSAGNGLGNQPKGLGQQILNDGGGGSLVTNWPPMDKSLTMPPSFSSTSTTQRLFCFRFLLSYEKYLKNLRPDQVEEIFCFFIHLKCGGDSFYVFKKGGGDGREERENL